MDTINQKIEEYKDILSTFGDTDDRYRFLISLAKKSQPFPEEFRLENFKVKGCMSQVWLVPQLAKGKVWFYSDSDAMIVKGTATLVSDIYSGNSAEEILANDKNLMVELDLGNLLSMNRRSGTYNMLLMVKEHAKMFI